MAMESPESQTTPITLGEAEIIKLRNIWHNSKKEALRRQLRGSTLKVFMLGRVKPIMNDRRHLRLYRGITSKPITRNLSSRTDFDSGLAGEYWTTDLEKAKRYSDLEGKVFQVELTAGELCDRSLVSVTDVFDEFRILGKHIQKRAQELV